MAQHRVFRVSTVGIVNMVLGKDLVVGYLDPRVRIKPGHFWSCTSFWVAVKEFQI